MSDLYQQLINWHHKKYPHIKDNTPSQASAQMLQKLVKELLEPLNTLGDVSITYGFVGYELNKHVQKYSPKGTCPTIDQHACYETNQRERTICERAGAACDILIKGYEHRMHHIVQYIVEHLSYDRIYFYGKDRPIHISVAPENSFQLQIMEESSKGRRYPGKRAYGTNAQKLAAEL